MNTQPRPRPGPLPILPILPVVLAALLAFLLLGSLLTRNSPHPGPDPAPPQSVPGDGVNTSVGPMVLDDVYVEAPHGVAAGASAPLRVALTNEAGRPDALVRVSTPAAHRVELLRDGHPVDRLVVPAHGQTNLERRTGLRLDGVRHTLRYGRQWFPVTFHFARAGTVTVPITLGRNYQNYRHHNNGAQP